MNSVWFVGALMLFAVTMSIPWERMGPKARKGETDAKVLEQQLPLSAVAANSNVVADAAPAPAHETGTPQKDPGEDRDRGATG